MWSCACIVFTMAMLKRGRQCMVWRLSESRSCWHQRRVFLIPPVTNVPSWTHPTTGFLWTNAEVFGKLHGSPTYAFDHDTQEYSQIQAASEYLLQQIVRVRQSQNVNLLYFFNNYCRWSTMKLRNRPVLFIGHGIGGLVAKWSLVKAHNKEFYQLFVNTTIGIILMSREFAPYESCRCSTLHGAPLNIF
jgi:hypothetical protein